MVELKLNLYQGGEEGDERESTRKDFKCLTNSLGFSRLTACPAFLIITSSAFSPKCL